MTSSNDITGARLVSKPPTEEYQQNHSRIFGDKPLKLNNNFTPPSSHDIPHWVVGCEGTTKKE